MRGAAARRPGSPAASPVPQTDLQESSPRSLSQCRPARPLADAVAHPAPACLPGLAAPCVWLRFRFARISGLGADWWRHRRRERRLRRPIRALAGAGGIPAAIAEQVLAALSALLVLRL